MRTCCVPYCNEKDSKNNKHSFHKLPNNLEMRSKWLNKINRPNFQPSTFTYICSKHFVKNDYEVQFGKRSLKKGVVPSIKLIVIKEKSPELRKRPNILQRSRNNERNKEKDLILYANAEKTDNTSLLNSEENIPEVNTNSDNEVLLDEKINIQNELYNSFTGDFDETIREDGLNDEFYSNELKSVRTLRYEGDFVVEDMKDQEKAEKYFHLTKKKLIISNRKIRTIQQTNRRLRKKFSDIKTLVNELAKNNMISKEAEILLTDILPEKVME